MQQAPRDAAGIITYLSDLYLIRHCVTSPMWEFSNCPLPDSTQQVKAVVELGCHFDSIDAKFVLLYSCVSLMFSREGESCCLWVLWPQHAPGYCFYTAVAFPM